MLNRDLDKESKDEIKKAVEAEVKKQVAALKLAPRDIGISFVKDSKIEIIAACDKRQPTKLAFTLKPGTDIPAANYKAFNTNLMDEEASFFVSVYHKGRFSGPMIKIPNIPNPYILANEGTITSHAIDGVRKKILDQIEDAVGVTELKDGKESAKLVFFVNVKCPACKLDPVCNCDPACKIDCPACKAASMRLTDEMDIKITAPCECCGDCESCKSASLTSTSVVTVAALAAPAGTGNVTPASFSASRDLSPESAAATTESCNCFASRIVEGAIR